MSKFFKGFTVKAVEAVEGQDRTFTGIASSRTEDRVKDILIPEGAIFTLPMPLLMHHDLESPVGQVTEATIDGDEIKVTFHIPEVEEPGTLKDRVDEAYQSIKYGLIKGLSVGFIADWDSASMRPDGGIEFSSWEWYELSLVTVPCNRDSSIDKSFSEHKKSCKKESEGVKSCKGLKIGSISKGGIKL